MGWTSRTTLDSKHGQQKVTTWGFGDCTSALIQGLSVLSLRLNYILNYISPGQLNRIGKTHSTQVVLVGHGTSFALEALSTLELLGGIESSLPVE